jgi:hypothetical protein
LQKLIFTNIEEKARCVIGYDLTGLDYTRQKWRLSTIPIFQQLLLSKVFENRQKNILDFFGVGDYEPCLDIQGVPREMHPTIFCGIFMEWNGRTNIYHVKTLIFDSSK